MNRTHLCQLCIDGEHRHSRYAAGAPEVLSGRVPLGAMAECGRIAVNGPECRCTYRAPIRMDKHCPTCRCGDTQ